MEEKLNNSLYDQYIKNPIKYTEDGLMLSNEVDIHIMSNHEDLIMRESARIICSNGGKILNVGFGMGIIDGYIRAQDPDMHVIIEAHPDVVKHAIKLGFDQTSIIYAGDWRDVISEFIESDLKFDGIYFDTIILDWERNEWLDFAKEVDKILAPGGIFAYFNHTAASMSRGLVQTVMNHGYQLNIDIIPLEDIHNSVDREFDVKLLQQDDYKLLWYIKTK